ncbi:hypothetical protein P0082_07705 [Candidatus Haliotispira prima]|uniref:Uncharacterized protein n=1 Tax=Candidatus Haliotispira prima TaxID=3034016 RepID=A0ABY8MFN8_9SPIO|nr:hypothetical protein P0082_07705 [Candidatus Haliotispira prima]
MTYYIGIRDGRVVANWGGATPLSNEQMAAVCGGTPDEVREAPSGVAIPVGYRLVCYKADWSVKTAAELEAEGLDERGGTLPDDPLPPEEEPKAEPKSKPKAEPKSKPKAEPKSKPKAEPKSKPKAEPKSKPEAEPKSKSKAEPKSKPKVEPKSKPKAEPKSKSKAEPKSSLKKTQSSELPARKKTKTVKPVSEVPQD